VDLRVFRLNLATKRRKKSPSIAFLLRVLLAQIDAFERALAERDLKRKFWQRAIQPSQTCKTHFRESPLSAHVLSTRIYSTSA
jgi:primosomal protein N''